MKAQHSRPFFFSLRILPLILSPLFILGSSLAQDIVLKDSFIKRYKDRVTITTAFVVDTAHSRPNSIKSGGDDGDLHIAGRSKRVGLPMVAEIVNARTVPDAVNLVHVLSTTRDDVQVTGIWRLWCEHPGRKDHIQGKTVKQSINTNPDHVFEIHPLTRMGSMDIASTVQTISGYDAYPASKVFPGYEKKGCAILHDPARKQTTIRTKKIGWNYVRFTIEITSVQQVVVPDGRFVLADVLGASGESLASDIRMVFLIGSDAERKVKSLSTGDRLDVLGIPRIDLNKIWERVKKGKSDPSILLENLPYEMIVLGVY